MSSIRAPSAGATKLLRSWGANEVVQPLLEPVLHPSRWRIRALGLASMVGHPLFYWIWAHVLPQPYESLSMRMLMSGLGVALLVFASITDTPPRAFHATVFTVIFWINLPFFFLWMYFCNGANTVWLGSVSAMFLIYYHVTDWRLATFGSISGIAAAWLAFHAFGPPVPEPGLEQAATNGVVIAFAWFMGIILGLSSSNLRREQLNHTLATMGIMAHELRTPLATMSLIGDAVRNEAGGCAPDQAEALRRLSDRLLATVRHMNHQIDSEIANARLTRLPSHTDTVRAAELVCEAVAAYPYRTERERDCVAVQVDADFEFRGSHSLFIQVLSNLIKNALRSLAASQNAPAAGDLLIVVEGNGQRQQGRIVVRDRGVGMEPGLQSRIFQPFFSTARGSGHGLGLAFCQRVVQSAHGTIHVESELSKGATFTIELPVLDPRRLRAEQPVRHMS